MVALSVSVTEGAVTRRIRIRAATVERALQLAGYGKEDTTVRVTSAAPAREILKEPESPLHAGPIADQAAGIGPLAA